MSQYVSRSDGPGSIGALRPLAALSHPPTIGSNAPRRVIGNVTHGARKIPAMGMGAYSSGVLSNGDGVFDGFGRMGTDEEAGAATNGNGNGFMGLPSWAPIAAVAALIGGVWYMKKKKAGGIMPNRWRDDEADAESLERLARPRPWQAMVGAGTASKKRVLDRVVELAESNPTEENLINALVALSYAAESFDDPTMVLERTRDVVALLEEARVPLHSKKLEQALVRLYPVVHQMGWVEDAFV